MSNCNCGHTHTHTHVAAVQGASCGCAEPQTVGQDDLTIVQGGSLVVQTPCADQCTPPSSSAAAAVQQAAAAANCQNYANSCLLSNLIVAELTKTGTLQAVCGSSWALPGLELYFPGLGYLEVLGATGDIITYENINIEPGTQILAGTCFHHDAPGREVESTGGFPPPGDVTASISLDGLYGFENNELRKILPADGTIIFGEGGKWVRKQLKLPRILRQTGSTPKLPNEQTITFNHNMGHTDYIYQYNPQDIPQDDMRTWEIERSANTLKIGIKDPQAQSGADLPHEIVVTEVITSL